MAKVDTIILNIEGKEYKYNVNVGKAGIFKCQLDWAVAEKLGLEKSTITSERKDDLTMQINKAYSAFIEATKVEEAFISIVYKSCADFSYNSEGIRMFPNSGNSHNLSISFDYGMPALAFKFTVYIRETLSTGQVIWYDTKKGGYPFLFEDDQEPLDPNKYYKNGQRSSIGGVLIPYSEQAMEKLEKAKEGIRNISEILFNFVSQDTEQIEALLLGGNLLPLPKEQIEEK